jgi:uncharacterized protein YjdB
VTSPQTASLTGTGAPVLQTITVTPSTAAIAVGQTQQFTATGFYNDGSQQNLTASATWNSSKTSVATVALGLATGVGAGKAIIRATQGEISGSATLTVTNLAIVSIAVTPANPSVALGTQQQFHATGTYSNGSTLDISNSVTWASSSSAVAIISSAGVATSKAVGQTTISAASGGVSGSTVLTVTPAQLVAISVTPPSASIPLGTTEQFTATGIFTDGTTQNLNTSATWTSSQTTVVTVSGGLAYPVAVGATTITASVGSVSGSAALTVTTAALVSIAVTPPTPSVALGNSQQFTATGTFTDGSTQNLTSQVSWGSATSAIASINASGFAMTLAAGTTQITATSGSVTGSATLTVTPATLVTITVTPAMPMVHMGEAQQFVATGTFTDGSIQDITQMVSWSSSNAAVASISMTTGSVGLATTLSEGTTTIIAAQGTVSGNTTLTVNPAVLLSITLTPSSLTLPKGTSQQLVATGKYSDGTTQTLVAGITWSSSDAAVATVSASGLVTAVAATGSATVTVQDGTVTGSLIMQVSGANLVSIGVSPSTASIPLGTTQQFTATGTYTDNSTQDLTASLQWMSSNPSVATISMSSGTNGLAQSLATGSTTVTALSGSISATATLSVTSAALVSIAIAPSNPTIDLGRSQQFTATGKYTDGSSNDLTSNVTWGASPATVAVISSQTGSQGLATSSGVGSATITATLGGVTSSTTLTVGPPTIVSIAVTPATSMISVGLTQQFAAIATYSDGTSNDVTASASVTWSSSAPGVAAMTDSAATGVSPGSVTITATSGSVQGTASLTVFALPLISSFAPVATTITAGGSATLTASFAGGTGLINPGAIPVANGTTVTVTPAATTTYTLTVTNGAGTFVTAQITVTVVAAPVITSFTAGAATIKAGSSTTLTAAFSGGTGSIDHGVGPVASGVSVSVAPAATTTYTLTVVNSAGSSTTATAGVVVTAVTLASITVTPANSLIPHGGTLQLTATGIYSDNATQDLTSLAAWTSSVPTTATIATSPAGTPGLANATGLGTTIITAAYGGITGSAILGVKGDGGLTPGDNMVAARDPFTSTLLPNGSVLVAGGFDSFGVPQSSAELYGPTGISLGLTGQMSTPRANHTATLLNNGKVLIVGGVFDGAGDVTDSAELYDPATGTFSSTGGAFATSQHTATVLQDGKVLIAGGWTTSYDNDSAAVYDPASGTFTSIGSMSKARDSHTATLLRDGTVLIAGGKNSGQTLSDPATTAEIYDPNAGTFSVPASGGLNTGRYGHTATALNDGTVLFTGGRDQYDVPLASAEVYSSGYFSFIQNLNSERAYHSATLLNNGMVLLAGGINTAGSPVDFLELYDPGTGLFSQAHDTNGILVNLSTPRYSHTATLLINGSVLLAGGTDSNGTAVATTELYQPLTFAPATVSAITISPFTPPGPVFQGNTLRFTALDQNGQPLASVTWFIYDTSTGTFSTIATISNDSSNSGTAQFTAPGSVYVRACAGTCGQSSSFTIGPPALVSITLTPQNPLIPSISPPNNTVSFNALGTFTDSSSQDVTAMATWTSSDFTKVTIGTNSGLATAVAFGQVMITASLLSNTGSTVTATTTLTVTNFVGLTASMQRGRYEHQAVVLGNGKVLLTGGATDPNTLATERTVELYDPANPGFIYNIDNMGLYRPMNAYRRLHSATVLEDGTVLIAGGRNDNGSVGQCGPSQACVILNIAELYDPAQGTFTVKGNLNEKRCAHTATRLNDGRVLITGGGTVDNAGIEHALSSVEIYSPVTGIFGLNPHSMSTPRHHHTATLLNGGMVLIAGGFTEGSITPLSTAEVYDPTLGTFTPLLAVMSAGRAAHAATLLPDGKVLLFGGIGDPTAANTADIYDPAQRTFTSISLPAAFGSLTYWSTLLKNGMVLLTDGAGTLLYDPASGGGFTQSGSLMTPRNLFSANLLNDGSVLFAGGITNNYLVLSSAELYPASSVASNSLPPPNLQAIVVTPLTNISPLTQGTTQQFIATGTFVDPNTAQISYQQLASVTWNTGDSTKVTITNDSTNSGMAYAVPQQGGLISPTNVLIKACVGTSQFCGSTTLRVQ